MTAGVSCLVAQLFRFHSDAIQSKSGTQGTSSGSPSAAATTLDEGKQFDGGNQSSFTLCQLTAPWCRVKLRSLFVPGPGFGPGQPSGDRTARS